MMLQEKLSRHIQKAFYCFFERFLSYLVCVPKFKSMNSSSISRKKNNVDNSTPTPYKRL